jgi:hypothetical protein
MVEVKLDLGKVMVEVKLDLGKVMVEVQLDLGVLEGILCYTSLSLSH